MFPFRSRQVLPNASQCQQLCQPMPTTMPTTMPANANNYASQCQQLCQQLPISIDDKRQQTPTIAPYQLTANAFSGRHKNNIVLKMSSILSSCPSLAPCAPISICPLLSSSPCAPLRLGTTPSFCPDFCPRPCDTKIHTTGCVTRFNTF